MTRLRSIVTLTLCLAAAGGVSGGNTAHNVHLSINSSATAKKGASSPILSNVDAPFVMELRLRGQPLSSKQKTIVQAAANRVASLITSRFQPVRLDIPPNACDSGLPAIHEQVSHFIAYITVKDLGNDVYGDSSPCELHDVTYLPIYAAVNLNSFELEDLGNDELLDTIIHELLHSLGVGTLWKASERVSLSGDSDRKNLIRKLGGKWYYTAPQALAAYRALGGQGKGILLDDDTGHWSGNAVCSEILSGTAGDVTDRVNPLSAITIGALADLGYGVNARLADFYRLPKVAGRCPLN